MTRNLRNESVDITINDGTGPIVFQCSTQKKLEVFKKNCVVQILTPELCDPSNTNPNMPFTKKPIYRDIGASDFVVSRVFIQSVKLMDGLGFSSHRYRDEIIDVFRDCRNTLVDSYAIACDLGCEIMELSKAYEANCSQGNVVSIPSVEGLSSKTKNFITNIKLTLQRFVDFFNIIFDTSFQGPRYDTIKTKFIALFGDDEFLSKVLVEYHDHLLHHINEIRNAIEHPKKNNRLKINNFYINHDRSIRAPTWQLHPNGDNSNIVHEMTLILINVVEFIELVVASSFLMKTNGFFEYQIRPIEEEHINLDCPIRLELHTFIQGATPITSPRPVRE